MKILVWTRQNKSRMLCKRSIHNCAGSRPGIDNAKILYIFFTMNTTFIHTGAFKVVPLLNVDPVYA